MIRSLTSTGQRKPSTTNWGYAGLRVTKRTGLLTTILAMFLPMVVFLTVSGCEDIEAPILISAEKEIELGGQVHDQIIDEFGEPLPSSHQLSLLVKDLGGELGVYNERENIPLKFYVLNTSLVNAFAGPGGFVYVTTGLLAQSKNAAELASVMAHEIGHVSKAHSIRALQLQLGASYLTQILLGEGTITDVLDVMVGIYLQTGYSQQNEFEADAFAVSSVGKTALNPYGMVSFFEFLVETYGDTTGILAYLSSHPSTTERIEKATLIIEDEFPGADKGGNSEYINTPAGVNWEEMKNLIPEFPDEQQ